MALPPTATAHAAATAPTFSAKLVSFHANDESGADWLGSDEVYAGFLDRSATTGAGSDRIGRLRAPGDDNRV